MSDSTMNVNAVEFVPGQPWTQPREPDFVTLLGDILYNLSLHPAAFADYMITITEAMNDSLVYDEQLEQAVSVIFEQSVLEPNFTYTGAKMCCYLINHLQLPPNRRTFRSFLNTKAKEVVMMKDDLLSQPDTAGRVHGCTMFLAELFLNMDVKGGKPKIYRMALQELLDSLANKPSEENLRCLGKLFKLSGAALEEFDKSQGNSNTYSEISRIFDKIRPIVLDHKFPKDVRSMWLHLLEYRASDWGKVSLSKESAFSPNAAGDSDLGEFTNAPVFFDSEGKIISASEAGFEDEFEKEFEAFIREDDQGAVGGAMKDGSWPEGDRWEDYDEPFGDESYDGLERFEGGEQYGVAEQFGGAEQFRGAEQYGGAEQFRGAEQFGRAEQFGGAQPLATAEDVVQEQYGSKSPVTVASFDPETEAALKNS